jgi:hypothetical protein
MTMATSDRAAALARLAELGAKTELGAKADEVEVKRTGEEVYAGGDEARVLVREAHLTYREGTDLLHAFASVGDTVLLTKAQAKRLDGLGVTVPVTADDEEVKAAASDDGVVTDEQLGAMSAADLIAHVGQNPDDRDRVRRLELERDEDKRRSTVLKATQGEDEDDPDEELDEDKRRSTVLKATQGEDEDDPDEELDD